MTFSQHVSKLNYNFRKQIVIMANFMLERLLSRLVFLLLIVPLSVTFFSACTSERFEANTSLDEFQKQYQKKNIETEPQYQLFPPETMSSDESTDYLLGSGDLVNVAVFETDELNAEVRVSARGTISLPMLDPIKVDGLTAAEAEEEIERILKIRYLHDPHVTVQIKEYISNQITLVGSLKTPGTYDYVRKRKLLDVIATSGGVTEDAGSIAFVTREDRKTGKRTSYRIKLSDLIRKGDMSQNVTILGGDVIFVPAAGRCFIDGAVRKPGTYPLKDKITITEAITLAGGLSSWADDDAIKLIRYTDDGNRKIVSLKYSELHGKLGESLILQDQDIVFAESSSSGKLFSGTGFSLEFLGTGVSYKDPQK